MTITIDGYLNVVRPDGILAGQVQFRGDGVNPVEALPQGILGLDHINPVFPTVSDAATALLAGCTCPDLGGLGLSHVRTSYPGDTPSHDIVRLLPSRIPGYMWGLVAQLGAHTLQSGIKPRWWSPSVVLYDATDGTGMYRPLGSIGTDGTHWGYISRYAPEKQRHRNSLPRAMAALEVLIAHRTLQDTPVPNDLLSMLHALQPLRIFQHTPAGHLSGAFRVTRDRVALGSITYENGTFLAVRADEKIPSSFADVPEAVTWLDQNPLRAPIDAAATRTIGQDLVLPWIQGDSLCIALPLRTDSYMSGLYGRPHSTFPVLLLYMTYAEGRGGGVAGVHRQGASRRDAMQIPGKAVWISKVLNSPGKPFSTPEAAMHDMLMRAMTATGHQRIGSLHARMQALSKIPELRGMMDRAAGMRSLMGC